MPQCVCDDRLDRSPCGWLPPPSLPWGGQPWLRLAAGCWTVPRTCWTDNICKQKKCASLKHSVHGAVGFHVLISDTSWNDKSWISLKWWGEKTKDLEIDAWNFIICMWFLLAVGQVGISVSSCANSRWHHQCKGAAQNILSNFLRKYQCGVHLYEGHLHLQITASGWICQLKRWTEKICIFSFYLTFSSNSLCLLSLSETFLSCVSQWR